MTQNSWKPWLFRDCELQISIPNAFQICLWTVSYVTSPTKGARLRTERRKGYSVPQRLNSVFFLSPRLLRYKLKNSSKGMGPSATLILSLYPLHLLLSSSTTKGDATNCATP